DPLRAALDRLFDIDEQPADVDVFPRGVGGEAARPIDEPSAIGKRPQRVYVYRVEPVLLALSDVAGEPRDCEDRYICRRLVDAAVVVDAGVDPGDVRRWREVHVSAGDRVAADDPGVIEGRVFGINRRAKVPDLVDAEPVGRIQDREPALEQLAMI